MDLQAEQSRIERVVAPRTRQLWWGAVLTPTISGLLLLLVLLVVPGAARDAVGALDPVRATVTGVALAGEQPRRTARLGPAWDVQVAWLESGSGRTATAKARGTDPPYAPGEQVTVYPTGSTAYFERSTPGVAAWSLFGLFVISLAVGGLFWRQRRRWQQLVGLTLGGAEAVDVEITRVEQSPGPGSRRDALDYRPLGSGTGGFFAVYRTAQRQLPAVGDQLKVWTDSAGRSPFLIRSQTGSWWAGRGPDPIPSTR